MAQQTIQKEYDKKSEKTSIVTVIVPVYMVEKYVDQCINSIIEQTYSNLEIILIDDGSCDNCSEICDSWAMKDERIIVIHKENGGLSSARNAGLDICKGDYITFIDSDDWVEQDYISVMHKALADNQAEVCSANMNEYDEDTGTVHKISKNAFIAGPEETLMKLYKTYEFPVGSAPKMYSADIWTELRFPVGHNYEDAYTTYLAVDSAQRIIHLSDALYFYRVRSGSIMTSSFSLSSLDRVRAWKENYLFCKEKYPDVAPYARIQWLEHIPLLLAQFPKKMNESEKEAKKWLKSEIVDNIGFVLFKMPYKKTYYQLKGLLFL